MDLKLPPLGEGADSGTVVSLFVKEGDQITKDQPILELENEKAVATIPSTADGTVSKLFVKSGDKISVGQTILSLTEGGAAPTSKVSAAEPEPKEGKARQAAPKETPVEPDEAEEQQGEPNEETT